MWSKTNLAPAVSLRAVSKKFYKQEQRTFKELLPALFSGRRTGEWFWALRDVNLTVQPGETVGIIGRNGSGKSTLLKIIAGVSWPTQGQKTINGRLAPLIELGAGFHPELTGRENIFLNGVILGLSRQEIKEQLGSIIAFSELSSFIDQPIKHYSSGMYLRLAFSVAIHTKPDVLLVDEILAVGDESFQKKCLDKMEQFQKQGVAILVVSHNLSVIEAFCSRVIVLDQGEIKADGRPKFSLPIYKKLMTAV